MKKLVSTIRTTSKKHNVFIKKKKLLCTSSGGQDSTLIYFILLHFQNEFQFQFETLYCHHFIQRRNFSSVWQLVRMNYLFFTPISIVLAVNNLQNENQARSWRKKIFERISLLQESSTFVFGHTASDKLETTISNLKRGTSSQGLNNLKFQSIYKKHSILIFFPFTFLLQKKEKTLNFLSNSKAKNKKYLIIFSKMWPLRRKPFKSYLTKKIQRKQIKDSTSDSVQLTNLLILTSWQSCYQLEIFQNVSTTVKKFCPIFETEFINKKGSPYFINSLYSTRILFSLQIFRPLLKFHRNDIRLNCQIYQFPIINDPTNELVELSRNQIRHQVLPLIRYFFSKKSEFFSFRSLALLMEEYQFFLILSETILINLLKSSFKKDLKFSTYSRGFEKNYLLVRNQKIFTKLSPSLQQICLQKLFFYYTNIQLTYSQIESLRLKFVKK